jgi:glutamate carboxypeptidase
VGHTDTVFPEDTSFNWYREDENRVYGPGVIDMKGGLAEGIFTLKALDAAKLLEKFPVTFLFNSDEEIGSPTSATVIENLARGSACAFVLECGGLDGGIVTGRKGKLGERIDVVGEAGHAAFAGRKKASAILELAHKVIALEALNAPQDGLTLNVGKVEGGIGPNTVPKHASALLDIRYEHPSHRQKILDRIDKIAETCFTPGTQGGATLVSERPPMPQSAKNRWLFDMATEAAKYLGIEVKEEFRSGVSDANVIASQGIPVLDGLGPIGALDHSEKEYMVKTTLVERTRLLAMLIINAWEKIGSSWNGFHACGAP